MKDTRLDNDRYEELQEIYLKTHDQAVFYEMYLLIKRFMFRTLYKYCRKNRLVFNETERAELIEDMTLQTVEQYLKHPDFKVRRMSAYAHFGFIKVMYNENRKREDLFFKQLNNAPEPERNEIAQNLGLSFIKEKTEFDSKR